VNPTLHLYTADRPSVIDRLPWAGWAGRSHSVGKLCDLSSRTLISENNFHCRLFRKIVLTDYK